MRRIARAALSVAAVSAALMAGVLAAPAATADDRSRAASGWFGYWTDPADMVAVARSSDGVLGEANIFWWHWAGPDRPICTTVSGGSCQGDSATPWTNARFDEARRGLQDLGVLVFATHTDLASNRRRELSDYLASSERRQSLAQTMTDWVVRAGVDGVDLDWENFAFNDGSGTWGQTRPRFTDFVARFGALLHAQGKLLSVTVPGGYKPFKDDGSPNPGGGYTVFDWTGLAPHTDRLRLMTYDYSWNRPGPIGPYGWARDSVRSAIAQVGQANASKIYVGLHQYGKAWYVRDGNDDVVVVGDCKPGWKPDGGDSISLTPAQARSLAVSYGQTPRFDADAREYTFDYTKDETGYWFNSNGQRRTQTCTTQKRVWFGGVGTAEGRAQIVSELGIGGLATWQLAALDSGYFGAIASLADPGVPTPAPTQTAPAPKPSYSMTLKAGKSTVRAGRKVVLRGRLRPKEEGTRVRRQIKVKGKWRNAAVSTTNDKGRVRFPVVMKKKPRRYAFRLKALRTDQHRVVLSNRVRVTAVR
jgi:spore germination protein YaaH